MPESITESLLEQNDLTINIADELMNDLLQNPNLDQSEIIRRLYAMKMNAYHTDTMIIQSMAPKNQDELLKAVAARLIDAKENYTNLLQQESASNEQKNENTLGPIL